MQDILPDHLYTFKNRRGDTFSPWRTSTLLSKTECRVSYPETSLAFIDQIQIFTYNDNHLHKIKGESTYKLIYPLTTNMISKGTL